MTVRIDHLVTKSRKCFLRVRGPLYLSHNAAGFQIIVSEFLESLEVIVLNFIWSSFFIFKILNIYLKDTESDRDIEVSYLLVQFSNAHNSQACARSQELNTGV